MGATIEGTRSYFHPHSSRQAVTLGRTGWSVCPVGFGGYRIQEGIESQAKALRLALRSGCNLIDTSTNYTDGASETLIGNTLQNLFSEKTLQREQVVVVSKVGYVQGSNLTLARERAKRGMPFPEMVEYSPSCWHCISPEFLKDQITRSLTRLKLKQIDVLLLHNPEYFLKAAQSTTALNTSAHQEYYRRIEAAFRYLETEVEAGRISYYGISSNTFPESREAEDYTSLEVVTEIAEKISSQHHFAVIQFPMNLFEPGAALEANNQGVSVAEYARRHGLGTLVNRPLNAFTDQRLVRLADFPNHGNRDIAGEFKKAMTDSTILEAQYPSLFNNGTPTVPPREVAWGHILRENFDKISDVDSWGNLLAHRIQPALEASLHELSHHPESRRWAEDYSKASSALFAAITNYLEEQASVVSDKIAGQLDHLCPGLSNSRSLSQKVIRLYRSITGIDCILVGMRQDRYVQDALELRPPVDSESARRTLLEFSKEVIFS